MARVSFNEKEVKKMSKSQFLKQFANVERFVEGGLEAYYDKLVPKKIAKTKPK
jgi:hypothetical protein